MAKTVDIAIKLEQHLKNIKKLKKDIKCYQEKKFLTKAFATLKI